MTNQPPALDATLLQAKEKISGVLAAAPRQE